MGLFSLKKTTYVSSVVYNMAGDEFKRPNYLKTTVSNAMIGGVPSLSEAIVGSYLNGPAIKFRSFLRWTDRTEYSHKIGLVTGTIKTGHAIDNDVVAAQLPVVSGSTTLVQNIEIGDAKFSYWVDAYILEHYPAEIGTYYTADINEQTGLITITFADLSITQFAPVDYDKTAQYLYVTYVYDNAGVASLPKIFIYKQLSGNALLDAMFQPSKIMRGFYPPIPFRLDNKFLSETYLPDIYKLSKKGYKKATTGNYDKLIKELKDNKSIDDIDYAYITFGVCLNVMEQASRKYIYEFFMEILNDFTTVGDAEHAQWQADWAVADTWAKWKAAQGVTGNPLNGTPEPTKATYPVMPTNSIKVSTGDNPTMNFDMTISWSSMTEQKGYGKLKPDVKPDTLWFEKGTSVPYSESVFFDQTNSLGDVIRTVVEASANTVNTITLNWQVTATRWRRLVIVGMKHINLIYGGKAVEIDAVDALNDPEESGFIVPLHDGVYREMGLKDGTQMTTACSYMVFNSYKVVKQKWYQTTLFKIIIVIIVIIIFIYTGYFDPNTIGLLGANAAVGAAVATAAGIAVSATVAALIGAIVNYIAALIVIKLITAAATAIFGEKWGPIIGAIASIFVLQVGTSMASGQSFGTSFSGMMSAQNIMKLTLAVGDGYAGYMQASAANAFMEQQHVLDTYKIESTNIHNMWEKTLGFDNGIIDPRLVTSAFGFIMEEPESFLQRTLMTGSDVAGMSMGMLTNYARMTLSTDLPT